MTILEKIRNEIMTRKRELRDEKLIFETKHQTESKMLLQFEHWLEMIDAEHFDTKK